MAIGRRKLLRFVRALVMWTVAFGVGGWVFLWYINLPVKVHIPPHKTMHPNAFDYYVRAKTDPDVSGSVLEWATYRTPMYRHENTPPSSSPGMPQELPNPKILPPKSGIAYYDQYAVATLAEKEALLRYCAAWMSRARSGFRYECVVPRGLLGQECGGKGLFIPSRLLLLDGQIRELHGDWDGALDAYIDSIKLGSDQAQGGSAKEAADSSRTQSWAIQNVWCCVPHVGVESARVAVGRLEQIEDSKASYADLLLEDRFWTQKWLMNLFRQPHWRRELADTLKNELPTNWLDVARCYSTSKAAMMHNCNECMDMRIAQARKPLPLDRTTCAYGLTFRYLMACPDGGRGRAFLWERARTMNRLFATALALRAWRLEHEAYPVSLQQLVPRYLSKVPKDPYTISDIFRYKRQGTSYLLYSIGPDFHDDDGKPVVEHYGTSKGDIVAGVTHASPALPRLLATKPPVRPIPRKIIEWQPLSNLTVTQYGMPGPPMPGPQ